MMLDETAEPFGLSEHHLAGVRVGLLAAQLGFGRFDQLAGRGRGQLAAPADGARELEGALARRIERRGRGLGAAAVVGREFLDRSVHDARALRAARRVSRYH